MKDICVKGIIKLNKDNDTWFFNTQDRDFVGEVPEAIDQLIDTANEDIMVNNEKVEIVIRLIDR